MPANTRLKGVTDLRAASLTEQIKLNLEAYLRWSFLEAWGYRDVAVTTPGTRDPYGEETLHAVAKDGVAAGRVWQAIHPQWCHESGLEAADDPTVASGVYVNGTLHPTASTTGPFAHRLDFRQGRVVFASPIAAASLVQVAHSYRTVGVFTQDVPWYRHLVLEEFALGQGEATVAQVADDYRAVAPFVLIEMVPRRTLEPVMLGSRANWVDQDVLLHIFADSDAARNNLVDALSLLKDQSLLLFDANRRRAAGDFDLDALGSPRAGASNYPALLRPYPDGYLASQGWFPRTQPSPVETSLPLFRGVVRATFRTDWLSA